MILPKLNLEDIVQIFSNFRDKMQRSDYLFVGAGNATNWLQMLSMLWQLGYPNVLIYDSSGEGEFYTGDRFPQLKLIPTSIEHYLWARLHWFDNLHGWEVRTILSNDPPRTLVDPKQRIYDGYALGLLREFIAYRNATFVPVLEPNFEVFSGLNSLKTLHMKGGDLCGNIFARNDDFSYTDSYMFLYANIMIASPQARPYYILEPLERRAWLLIALYVLVICGFCSFVCWLQNGRWEWIKIWLEIVRSLVYAGFQLREIAGRLHCILYGIICFAGFIYSNYYVAFLHTLLSTGLYEQPIRSFEELVRSNLSIIISEYDKTVLTAFDYPSILWNITRIMPFDFILKHRGVFDTNYAYLAISDKQVLYRFQQQYMKKPKMRIIHIDIVHALTGYPMQREWLLKFKLSETLLNCFASGLIQKFVDDTNMQTIRMRFLEIMPSKKYEVEPLTLDNFMTPLLMLAVGIGMGFICLLGELLWHRKQRREDEKKEKKKQLNV